MQKNKPLVYIIDDDDASVGKSLQRLIRSAGMDVEVFLSAHAFLEHKVAYTGPSCMLLDVQMPEMDGLDLQKKLTELNRIIPIIFMTAYGDIPMAVKAIKNGAEQFLEKPFSDHDLLKAIHLALEKDTETKKELDRLSAISHRAAQMTPRERDVFKLVVTGMLNKNIAQKLGIVEKTVKVHRARVMEKMQAKSVVDLARMADAIGISSPEK